MSEALIEPVLSRADSTGMPCYLETFSEKRLSFYKDFGFRITGAGRIPDEGPNFWAMTRAAGSAGLVSIGAKEKSVSKNRWNDSAGRETMAGHEHNAVSQRNAARIPEERCVV